MRKSLVLWCVGIIAFCSLQANSTSAYDLLPGGATGLPSISAPAISTVTVPLATAPEAPSLSGALTEWDAPMIPDEFIPFCAFCKSTDSSSMTGESASPTSTSASTSVTKISYLIDETGKYYGTATVYVGRILRSSKFDVKVVFKLATGVRATAAKTKFARASDGVIYASWSNVKKIGNVSLAVLPDGTAAGTAGIYGVYGEYAYSDVFVHGEHVFSVLAGDFKLPSGYALIEETIPTEAAIVTSDDRSWNTGKAPSIKYKKFKVDDYMWYELQGLGDDEKPNYSRLKLSFNKKKGTFTGSFRVYATNGDIVGEGKPPKLEPYMFKVDGAIVGTEATGVATCKKLNAIWPVTIE